LSVKPIRTKVIDDRSLSATRSKVTTGQNTSTNRWERL